MKTSDRALLEVDRILGGSPPPPPKAAVKTVLLVDDDDEYRGLLAFLLRDDALRVLQAPDGAAGLKLALEARPDLILVDYQLPRLNGYEMIQELKQRHETMAIPVIMFTGSIYREQLKELDFGIEEFLCKPIPNKVLLDCVSKVLGVKLVEPGPSAVPKPPAPAPAPAPQAGIEADEKLLVMLEEDAPTTAPAEDAGLEAAAQDSSLVSQVNRILIRAVEMRASDIHIEPQEDKVRVRVRVDGSLHSLCVLPLSVSARFTARVKIMSNLVITERRLPQDGQFRVLIKGVKIEFRVSCLPCTYGEKIVIRILGQSKLKSGLEDMGMSERDLACVRRALRSPHGLILVTGPTGSGKTTSLYTMLGALNKPDVNILTAEDPVEYRLPGISQVQVMPSIGLNFESALRSFLRQDPDVMLVGEIRDRETADIAVKASITGHVVLSTLHTNSAPATITRLTHMGLAPFLAAASVKLIVAQRLVKLLCPACKRAGPLTDEDRTQLREDELAKLGKLCRAAGCPACNQTGFSGRKAIYEVMPVATAKMRQAILTAQDADALTRLAVEEGMTTLRQSALNAAAAEETSLDEAFKIMFAE